MISKIGARIKQLRERRGWSQKELGERVRMNHSVLSRIESNKRPLESEELRKFAEVFEVTTDLIIGHSSTALSHGANEFKEIIDLSEDEAIHKIQEMFTYKGNDITEDQSRMIYYLSLGVVKKD